jgi:hypothetical protein
MHVTAETVTLSSERFSLDADAPRFDGCHISTIVNYMEQKQYGAREESATQAGFSCGFLFERLMAREAAAAEASSAAIVRVGEIIWCVQCRTPYFVWEVVAAALWRDRAHRAGGDAGRGSCQERHPQGI